MPPKQSARLGPRGDGGEQAAASNLVHQTLDFQRLGGSEGSEGSEIAEEQIDRNQQDIAALYQEFQDPTGVEQQHPRRLHHGQEQVVQAQLALGHLAQGQLAQGQIIHDYQHNLQHWTPTVGVRYPSEGLSNHPTPPDYEFETEVMATHPNSDSLDQGASCDEPVHTSNTLGDYDHDLVPTTNELGVYDPRLLAASVQHESNNIMPSFNPGSGVHDAHVFNFNSAESQYEASRHPPIHGSYDVQTNQGRSQADHVRYTIPPPIRGWAPPPGQTSFGQDDPRQTRSQYSVVTGILQEANTAHDQVTSEHGNVQGEGSTTDRNATGFFAHTNLHTKSLDELTQLYEEYFGDYARDSFTGPDGEVYDSNNLPPSLFELEDTKPKTARSTLLECGFLDGPGGMPLKGPNGCVLLNIPYVPRYISTLAEGWMFEALDRMERRIEDSDYVARMHADEFLLAEAIKHAKKVAEAKSKGKSGPQYKPDTRNLAGKNIKNAINMRRGRGCREPLGTLSRDPRSKKGDPSEAEVSAASRLSDDSIKHNTTLEVTPEGLQRVRLQGNHGQKKTKVNLEGQFWPLGKFLKNGKYHEASPRLLKLREVANELNQKLEHFGVKEWKELPREELPQSWFAKADKAKGRKRKAEDTVDTDTNSKKLKSGDELRGARAPPEESNVDENMPGPNYVYPVPPSAAYTTHVVAYRQGMIEEAIVNLEIDNPDVNAVREALRDMWRERMENPVEEDGGEDIAILEALREEFGN